MYKLSLFHHFLIGFAVVTALGVLLHDTKADEAVALAVPIIAVTFSAHAVDFGEGAHTHEERSSVAQSFGSIPKVRPRDDHRQYVLPKSLKKSADLFGSSNIIWPSI